jgi:hypothetical protein
MWQQPQDDLLKCIDELFSGVSSGILELKGWVNKWKNIHASRNA